jgi:hypothetical protein
MSADPEIGSAEIAGRRVENIMDSGDDADRCRPHHLQTGLIESTSTRLRRRPCQ